MRYGLQALLLYGAEVCAEECDGWDADLVEAHDAPWALDEDEAVGVVLWDPMEVVEELIFWQPWREVPLTAVSDGLWIEPSCGIAEGPCMRIVESYADGPAEETRSSIEARLEALRGVCANGFALEEIDLRFQWQAARVG